MLVLLVCMTDWTLISFCFLFFFYDALCEVGEKLMLADPDSYFGTTGFVNVVNSSRLKFVFVQQIPKNIKEFSNHRFVEC